jgi:hypothetical protein
VSRNALGARDKKSAQSLIKQFDKNCQLSDRQWPWVAVLADRIECAGAPDFTKETVQIGEFQGVIALFDKAKEHLKYPKITLALGTEEEIKAGLGKPVQLSVAGPASKYAGMVCVTDGKPFGQNKWYGPVAKDGAGPRPPRRRRSRTS